MTDNKNENENTSTIKDYLLEQNKNFIGGLTNTIKTPIESITSNLFSLLKPQAFVKNFGLMTSSPILMMIGNKIEDMTDNLKTQITTQKNNKKHEFLKEAQTEKEIALQEENNSLLKDISKKEFSGDMGVEEKKAGIFKTMLGGILGGIGIKTGIGLGGGLGMLKGFKKFGIKGLGKVAIKGLGKVALPLALAMSAFDFAKGFGNAMEITGRDDLMGKIQAGMSSAISGLTFGLIDAKTISQNIDKFKEFVINIFVDPIKSFEKIFAKSLDIGKFINKYLSILTFDLIPSDIINNSLIYFKDTIKFLFVKPIEMIKKIFAMDFNFYDIIKSVINTMPLFLISKIILKDAIIPLKDKIKDLMTKPIDIILEYYQNFMEFFNSNISKTIEKIVETKDKILNLIKNPKDFIMSFFKESQDSEIDIVPEKKRKKKTNYKNSEILDKISVRNEPKSSPLKKIKETRIKEIITEKNMNEINTTNNQTILNTKTNNNIIQDDMSIQSDDNDYYRLEHNFAW